MTASNHIRSLNLLVKKLFCSFFLRAGFCMKFLTKNSSPCLSNHGLGQCCEWPHTTIPTQHCHSPADPRHSLLFHPCSAVIPYPCTHIGQIHLIFFFPNVTDIRPVIQMENNRHTLMWMQLSVSLLNTSSSTPQGYAYASPYNFFYFILECNMNLGVTKLW